MFYYCTRPGNTELLKTEAWDESTASHVVDGVLILEDLSFGQLGGYLCCMHLHGPDKLRYRFCCRRVNLLAVWFVCFFGVCGRGSVDYTNCELKGHKDVR